MKHTKTLLVILALVMCAAAYASESKGDPEIDKLESLAKRDKGYRPLFKDDLSNATFREGTWEFNDGIIAPVYKPNAPKPKKTTGPKPMRDLWTQKRYGDFILDLEFKCAENTNSGIFVRTDDVIQWLHTGIEIQVLQPKAKSEKNDTGSIYDCLAPTKQVLKEPGEWNHFTVICNDNWIHVIINGERVTDMNLDLWTEAHKNPDGSPNKFNNAYKDMPREGHIGLQFHGSPVWFKNIRIKERRK